MDKLALQKFEFLDWLSKNRIRVVHISKKQSRTWRGTINLLADFEMDGFFTTICGTFTEQMNTLRFTILNSRDFYFCIGR